MIKILFADDEVIERIVLEKKLRKYYGNDCQILVAKNGREVLEQYEREHPQILILDIEMPVINGLEAAREIRRKDRLCSIIFLTAFDEFSYAKAAITVHALDYLLKPCDEHDLINAVDEAIRFATVQAAAQSAAERYENQPALAAMYGNTREQAADGNTQEQADIDESSQEQAAVDENAQELEARELSEEQQEGDERQEEFRTFIVEHYMEDIAVKDIASYFGYSEAYFCKRFKQYFGHSFVSYLTDYRMQRAEELMRTSNLSIKEIGKAVGYADPNYFTKVFRRVRGVSPSGFRDAEKQ